MDTVISKVPFYKTKNGKMLSAAILVCTLILVGTFALRNGNVVELSDSEFVIGQVKQGDLVIDVTGTGFLKSLDFSWISSPVRAKVEEVYVKSGAMVSPDTLLLKMSSVELTNELEQARWNMTSAENELLLLKDNLENRRFDLQVSISKLKSDYKIAKVESEAQASLAERGIVSNIEAKQLEMRVEELQNQISIENQRLETFNLSIDSQLETQKSRVSFLTNVFKRLELQHEALDVRAGLEGVVQAVPVVRGLVVDPGTSLALVADPRYLIAELNISEGEVNQISLGQKALINVNNTPVEGEVFRIDSRVQEGSVKVDVKFNQALPDGARADLSVEGAIKVAQLANVLYVDRPYQARQGSVNEFYVINEETQLAYKQHIEFGKSSASMIEVKSGVNLDDRLIISDVSRWQDYATIRVIN